MPAKPDDLNQIFDEILEEMDEANALRIDYDVPTQWRSTYYLRAGYLLRFSSHSSSKPQHFRGSNGPTKKCPTCQQQLKLLLDLDCGDKRFQKEKAPMFGGLERLPLYYCFRCTGNTTYRVLKNRVTFIKEECTKDDSPFEEVHENLRQREPVELKRISPEVEDLLIIAQEFTENWLSAKQKRAIQTELGVTSFELSRSQLGGVPGLMQGHRNYSCKNPKCKTHRMGSLYTSHGNRYKMKELATIAYDLHGYESGRYSTIVFHICWYCHTVTSEYECT